MAIVYNFDENNPINSDTTISIWGQRTLNATGAERAVRRELESNWTLEDNGHLQALYDINAYSDIINNIAEQIRNSIDSSILESIAGVQPMASDTLDGFFKIRKRKKIDLRLPDKLFEME